MGLVLLNLGLWSCDEDNLPLEEHRIEVRVITEKCGQAVMQIVSPEHSTIGQDSWTNDQGYTYHDVFSTRINCEDAGKIPEDGSSFYITLLEDPIPRNCVTCLAIPASMPELRLHVSVADHCGPQAE